MFYSLLIIPHLVALAGLLACALRSNSGDGSEDSCGGSDGSYGLPRPPGTPPPWPVVGGPPLAHATAPRRRMRMPSDFPSCIHPHRDAIALPTSHTGRHERQAAAREIPGTPIIRSMRTDGSAASASRPRGPLGIAQPHRPRTRRDVSSRCSRRSQADARFCMSSRSARRPAMVAGGRSRDVGAPAWRLDRQRQHTEIRATHKAPALGERARPPRTRRSPTTTASGARCLGRRRSSATPPIVPDRRNAFRRRCDRGDRRIRATKAPARAVSLGARLSRRLFTPNDCIGALESSGTTPTVAARDDCVRARACAAVQRCGGLLCDESAFPGVRGDG